MIAARHSTTPSRADELSSLGDVARCFVGQRSPRILVATFLAVVVARLAIGGIGVLDVVVAIVTVGLIGPFEWVVHRHLLHAPETSVRMRRLGTGRGHREHHRDPDELEWLLLCWRDAAVFAVGLAPVVAIWVWPVALIVGRSPVTTVATAWCVALAALVHYEWTHLLVHARYRPRNRHYRALAKHHRMHHHRDAARWLGVTARTGDRLLGTFSSSE